MKWIIITSPEFLSGEAIFIDKLFSQGLDLLHLRKPEASLEAYKRLLLQIPKHWYSRIVLHEHFALAEKFGLHGIHLNRRCSQVPDSFRGSISCSCHTLEEVKKQKASKDYVFLSPIFDSISKVGYHAAFSSTLLSHPLKTIFQHKACTDKLYADSFYKIQKNSHSSFEVICCRG